MYNMQIIYVIKVHSTSQAFDHREKHTEVCSEKMIMNVFKEESEREREKENVMCNIDIITVYCALPPPAPDQPLSYPPSPNGHSYIVTLDGIVYIL